MALTYLSIPKLQRPHRWSLGRGNWFHPKVYDRGNKLGLELIHESKGSLVCRCSKMQYLYVLRNIVWFANAACLHQHGVRSWSHPNLETAANEGPILDVAQFIVCETKRVFWHSKNTTEARSLLTPRWECRPGTRSFSARIPYSFLKFGRTAYRVNGMLMITKNGFQNIQRGGLHECSAMAPWQTSQSWWEWTCRCLSRVWN